MPFAMSEDWVEVFVLCVLILGFILSVFTDSLSMKFLLVFFVGIMFGRVWFRFKKKAKFALTAIIAGFLFGFLLGNLLENTKELTLLFLFGIVFSYWLHEKKFITSW